MVAKVKFLPPWYPVENCEAEAVFAKNIRRCASPTGTLSGNSFTVFGVCRARDEMVIRIDDGRLARVILTDSWWEPLSNDNPLEIEFFDTAGELNAFIQADAANHQ